MHVVGSSVWSTPARFVEDRYHPAVAWDNQVQTFAIAWGGSIAAGTHGHHKKFSRGAKKFFQGGGLQKMI